MTNQYKTIAEMPRILQVLMWWVGAMTELERLGMVKTAGHPTSIGISIFDQIDSECPPTNDELRECHLVMSRGDLGDEDVAVGLRLLIGYRDQRDDMIAFCDRESGGDTMSN